MARQEVDKEDLMRDATALQLRAELRIPGLTCSEGGDGDAPESIVAGFRDQQILSLFIGPDPVYHFNAKCELRRAYYRDRLYKAESERLVSLQRIRTADEVQLIRHELDADETDLFLSEMTARCQAIVDALHADSCEVLKIVGDVTTFKSSLRETLTTVVNSPTIAQRPNVAG